MEFKSSTSNNLLPYDGEVYYFGKLLSEQEAQRYFKALLDAIDWKPDEVIMFGKKIVTKRKTGWYGTEEFEYTYSKVTRKAKLWTPELKQLKKTIEEKTGQRFNSCLLNLYHNGEEGMSWHTDDEPELGEEPVIASLSLGAVRNFVFKHKISKEKISLELPSGSLLVMQGETQKYWLHSLPKTKRVKDPRINLTFRNIQKTKK